MKLTLAETSLDANKSFILADVKQHLKNNSGIIKSRSTTIKHKNGAEFFLSGFTFTTIHINHRTLEEGKGFLFNPSLQLAPAFQTFRH